MSAPIIVVPALVLAMRLALVLALFGCGSEPTTPVEVGPSGRPAVTFLEPSSNAPPECRAIGTDVQMRVALLVHVEEVLLRAPGACAGLAQCGRLQLFADGVLNNESASMAIDLLLAKLASPYHDGSEHPGTGQADLLTVRVELVDDDGAPFLDADGVSAADEAKLMIKPACP
ncbi:MAG: hypothetical protein EXR75_07715 [Myxococcales bacterium]|nr:hypothetical protein [Myxococcales bacterium]